MKIDFLIKKNCNHKLILIYSGWSCGPELYSDIYTPGWDVAVAHCYDTLEIDLSFLDEYTTVYLFAWSLGVAAAALTLPPSKITNAIAINGTLRPVDNEAGIPEAIYCGTEDGLNPQNLRKFRARMAGDKTTLKKWFASESDNDDIESLKEQLHTIKMNAGKIKPGDNLPWSRAFISDNDYIFPPGNQHKFWNRLENVVIIRQDSHHFIPMSRIVSAVIPDYSRIAEHFSKALSTYDSEAVVQLQAAEKLLGRITCMNPGHALSVLEIGPGSGLLTHRVLPLLKPKEATFVDIIDLPPFSLCEKETYHCCDAERWIEVTDSRFDMIISSSTLQWLSDLQSFLHKSSEILNPNGILAVSLYITENLKELDEIRPAPLLYHSAEEIKEWLSRDFSETKIEVYEYSVCFDDAISLLRHLKKTGVSGTGHNATIALSKIRNLTKLTYKYAVITARKL